MQESYKIFKPGTHFLEILHFHLIVGETRDAYKAQYLIPDGYEVIGVTPSTIFLINNVEVKAFYQRDGKIPGFYEPGIPTGRGLKLTK